MAFGWLTAERGQTIAGCTTVCAQTWIYRSLTLKSSHHALFQMRETCKQALIQSHDLLRCPAAQKRVFSMGLPVYSPVNPLGMQRGWIQLQGHTRTSTPGFIGQIASLDVNPHWWGCRVGAEVIVHPSEDIERNERTQCSSLGAREGCWRCEAARRWSRWSRCAEHAPA